MNDYIHEMRSKIGHSPLLLSVVTAIIYKDGKVLLQKRTDDGKWAIHGGSVELGEKLSEAMERELGEEIGIKPIDIELFGIYSGKRMYHVYPNEDIVYSANHVFFCTKWEGELAPDQDEVSALKWFDIEDMPKEKDMMDADYYVLKDLKKFIQDHKPVIE